MKIRKVIAMWATIDGEDYGAVHDFDGVSIDAMFNDFCRQLSEKGYLLDDGSIHIRIGQIYQQEESDDMVTNDSEVQQPLQIVQSDNDKR